MKTVKHIDTHGLRNDEHFQFMTEFKGIALKIGAETLKIGQLFDKFTPLYEREDEALKKIVKSEFTEKIHDLDKERDTIYRKLAKLSLAFVHHHDHGTVESAKRLKILFGTYGNIAKKPLNEKSAAIHNIVQELEGKFSTDVSAVGTGAWVALLKTANSELIGLVQERYDETHARTDIVLKDARAEVDDVYRKIIKRVDSYMDIEGPLEQYTEFIDRLNIVIKKYAAALKARTGKKQYAEYDEHDEHGEHGETGDQNQNL